MKARTDHAPIWVPETNIGRRCNAKGEGNGYMHIHDHD